MGILLTLDKICQHSIIELAGWYFIIMSPQANQLSGGFKYMKQIVLCLTLLIFLAIVLFVILSYSQFEIVCYSPPSKQPIVINAYITGYNTVPEQTDSTPCYAGNIYICGRDDVVACPRWIEKGTWIEIESLGRFECLDRTHYKFNDRFDVSCDKDFECPYMITGWELITIYLK